MWNRKILFFVIVGIVAIVLVWALMSMTWKEKNTTSAPKELKIWINEGTTEDFQKIADGFKSYNPSYKNTNIIVEKPTEDPDRYRTLLLGTMVDKTGPDIFMIRHGEDQVLESQNEPIPGSAIDIDAFEKSFDTSVFADLLTSSGAGSNRSQYLLGVPLGYETLGIFYNRSLMRTGVPKDWNEVERLYPDFPTQKYPTNLGLGPAFVPNVVDVMTLFFVNGGATTYSNLSSAGNIMESYSSYADLAVANTASNTNDPYTTAETLRGQVNTMRNDNITTVDMFIRGDIGMIIGYPSFVIELEKAQKRSSGQSAQGLILTEQLPIMSRWNNTSIARYTYFGISRVTEKPDASLAFLEYLMSEDAGRKASETYPYLIPAQVNLLSAKKWKALSSVFENAKIDAFLPLAGQRVITFNYGFKSQFKSIFEKYFDNTSRTGSNEIPSRIATAVQCEVNTINRVNVGAECDEY